MVTLGSKNNRNLFRVHRIIAQTFIPNPNNYSDVDHLDSNRQNNCAENLEWCTHQENIIRSYERGDHNQKGSSNARAKLNESDVLTIRYLYNNKLKTQKELSDDYNCGWSTIHNVVFDLTWKHI